MNRVQKMNRKEKFLPCLHWPGHTFKGHRVHQRTAEKELKPIDFGKWGRNWRNGEQTGHGYMPIYRPWARVSSFCKNLTWAAWLIVGLTCMDRCAKDINSHGHVLLNHSLMLQKGSLGGNTWQYSPHASFCSPYFPYVKLFILGNNSMW